MTGSWNDLDESRGREGRMFILDDFQEAIGEANLINGLRPQHRRPRRARGVEADPARPEGVSRAGSPRTRLRTWSTAPRRSTRRGTATSSTSATRSTIPRSSSYETCKEGVPVGTDLMCIPITARAPGHGAAVHRLDHPARQRRAEREWNGYPQPSRAARRRSRSSSRTSRRSTSTSRRSATAAWSTGSTTPTSRALWNQTSGRRSRRRELEGLLVAASCCRAASGCSCCFAVPICLVLALSFGYTDDLGRAVYSFRLDNYADAFNPLYIPVMLRSVLYALATAVALPADRLPDRLLHRPLRGPLQARADRAAGAAVLRQLPGPHLRLGRAARRRGARQQRPQGPRPDQRPASSSSTRRTR